MIRDLFRLKGEITRDRYLVTGLALFALKYALDFCLTTIVFHRDWSWFPYFDPLVEYHGLHALMADARQYALSMLTLALPFVWIGTAMTSRRLRSAGLPLWPVILFFVPVINLATIGVLCVLPERLPSGRSERPEAPPDSRFGKDPA